MLLRGAWSNYLIRATLSLDTADGPEDGSLVMVSSKNQREKCELLFNQLKQQLFEPSNTMEDYFQLFTDLKRATQKNFLMKKLFWRSGDILTLIVQQLQQYMPRTEANLHTEEGRAQRVDELEFVILLVTTLSLMFRESEILLVRMQALKAELYQLLSEYIRVSITAIFELFLMARQNQFEQDEGVHFTVNWMVKVMEESKNMNQFIERVMSQVLEVINLARFGAVSSDQAVNLYQQFSILLAVLEHSSSVLAFLRNHYHEEFKYFIQGPALARKLPVHFPITPTTVQVVSQVTTKVLGQPQSKGSRPAK